MEESGYLQIRMTVEDKHRLGRVAEADHLKPSTWARQALLRAIQKAELDADRRRGGGVEGRCGIHRSSRADA